MAQIIVNIIIATGVTTLIALGFALIYQTTHFFDFAYGIILTSGAYFIFLFKEWLHFPLIISAIIAAILSALLGCLIDFFIYRQLRKQGATSLILLLASLGTYTVLQNVISIIFGDTTRTIRSGIIKEGISFLDARITSVQISIVCVSLLLVIAVALFLKKTRTGQAIRAVANDPQLAEIAGIKSDRIIGVTFALGSALAGVAGILISFDIDVTPTMGMNSMMAGVVAAIVGGVGSISGALLGALFLSTAQNVGAAFIGFQWQETIAFILLLAFLLLKPQGFLGKS
ncbi:branched-chain amino acid ABC transporter permease [Scytonema sp. UIC 10036]|uniref:branched-chain amino acid ABC transporter permease n=1 Tax=Scytonema sp. UIC 10036 TaxID=2304196 RepID=UPI0012DA6C5C|nr:branched-chain amino acid ABC transporter permease [Scytonema sp. UIC 10036]MUG99235.1 branched-chain amino acid ABC transporter permease [Scytonema sp. UIC 10036]